MITQTLIRLLGACLLIQAAGAAVEVQAQYNLKGAGGIRDTACPETLASQAGNGPALARHGSPKVMSNGPEARRLEYDSSIKFEQTDQCYSVGRNLVGGDNFLVEAWAYALKPADGGWHSVVASGTGASGFILGQHGDQWALLVGGVGDTSLAKVVPEKWTHLALVKSRGTVSAWIDGVRVKASLPGIGGGHPNFAIGATAPNKEAFSGWVAEVRHATFKPGAFDPATDFLMDSKRLKEIQAGESAARTRMIDSLAATPGVAVVKTFDERPYQDDWLIKPPALPASVQVLAAPDRMSARIMLANGLVSRTFLVTDNLGCVSMRRSDKDIEFVRSVKPEVRFRINDGAWLNIGGLTGMMDRAFIAPEWFGNMESITGSFRFAGMSVGPCVKPYEWQPKCNAPADIPWPAKGKRVVFRFAPPEGAAAPLDKLTVNVVYEIYEGLPVIMKTFEVKNGGTAGITVSQFEGEHLAVQPSNSRMLHVESDYHCALINFTDKSSGLGIHAGGGRAGFKDYYLGGGTTRFIRDPEWGSMATLNPAEDIFLGDPENALLLSRPSVGPDWTVKPGESFDAFRTFEILNDTTERERFQLAQRRFYRKLAPQTNEKMFEVHAPVTRDLKILGPLMDQMAEVGFNQLQAPEHPGGFNYADTSPGNIASMKAICDYAKPKNIRVGAYQLMMASAGWGSRQDNYNCIDPASKQPGSAFGQSACGASAWADMYYDNMWKTIEATGMGAFKPDGPYHGDPCAATDHPHHKGLADSQWAQWKWMCKVLHEGQRRNLYLTIPDWYVLNGQACTGMGYREATDNIDIVLQTVIYRQYIFDATFHKTAQMGWVNLNTEMLRGGMEANLDKYERILFTMLSSGAQVWVRGHRLYDGPKSKEMLLKWMAWYRKYEKVILGDIIHLKRPDGRGLDYYLHANPAGPHKGMLLVFNPLDHDVAQTLQIPLYYTGLSQLAKVREGEGVARNFALDPAATLRLPVTLPASGYSWFIIE